MGYTWSAKTKGRVQGYLNKLRSKPSPWGGKEVEQEAKEDGQDALGGWARHQKSVEEFKGRPSLVFRKNGGRMSRQEFNLHVDKSLLNQTQKEYVKELMAKFDKPYEQHPDREITEAEFQEGLRQLEKDFQSPLGKAQVEMVRTHFGSH